MSSQSAVSSRTLRVHHPTGAAGPISSDMHRMQILASFESPKLVSEGRPAREGASPKGARPCPHRARGEWCLTLTLPCDTTCIRPKVQRSWALWAGAMRFVDELRREGLLRVCSKGVGLLRDHRLCRPSGGYGIGVSMHHLPAAAFGTKEGRNPQSERRDVLPAPDLGPPLF